MATRRGGGRRVAVTGVGAVSALAPDAEGLWQACLAGRTVAAPVPAEWHRYSDLRSQVWSPLGEAARPASSLLGRVESKRLDGSSQMALAAAEEALRHGGVELAAVDAKRRTFRLAPWNAERTGVFMGSGAAGLASMVGNAAHVALARPRRRLLELGKRLAAAGDATTATALAEVAGELVAPALFNPFVVAMTMGNALSANLSIKLGIHGPTPTFAGACAAGTMAIGSALRAIRDDVCDAALAGGSDYLHDPWGATFRAFDAVGALAHGDEPAERLNRPFDARRSGFLFSEGGCGVLLLESFESAQRRGATVLAELAGYGEASDAHDVMAVDPEGEQVRRAITGCLDDAGIDPEDVDYVNAHGTGTPGNDVAEARAIHAVFGDHASSVAVSSTKSMHGHALGAAGALEAVATARALHHGVLPPTANFTVPDPECELDVVPNVAREV
ncbi:MAG TPA: beta-ketoacyl-[acyl-carrier-protein] synthase family protein, partial [Thermoanaerobaculia bacterium]|nr:beta-ketoacyl-[acyl-carrier-protein] synthase family protein [Thermoanaerobaculia bacterium]